MNKPRKIVVAITGASGAIYARLLVEKLLASSEVSSIALILSENGRLVAQYEGELNAILQQSTKITLFPNDDLFSAPASGSADYDSMVVVPCSMGTLGRIASGVSADLIGRAADVMLKERRKLILVARESPYNAIHLANMATLAQSGAVILPASPSFYSRPQNIEELCLTVVERIMAHLDLDSERYRWGEE